MICGITLAFAGKGTMEPLLKLIAGLVLTFSVIRPVLAISAGDLQILGRDFQQEGEAAAAQGEKLAEDALADIIKQETETYILDKAYDMELDIQVRVEVGAGNPPVPERVWISGNLSPYDKKILSHFITHQLGIPEERQQWNP